MTFFDLPLFLCGVEASEGWGSHNSLLNVNSSFFPNFSWKVKIKGLSKWESSHFIGFNMCLQGRKAILKEHIMYLFFLHKTKGRRKDNKKRSIQTLFTWAINIF